MPAGAACHSGQHCGWEAPLDAALADHGTTSIRVQEVLVVVAASADLVAEVSAAAVPAGAGDSVQPAVHNRFSRFLLIFS